MLMDLLKKLLVSSGFHFDVYPDLDSGIVEFLTFNENK